MFLVLELKPNMKISSSKIRSTHCHKAESSLSKNDYIRTTNAPILHFFFL